MKQNIEQERCVYYFFNGDVYSKIKKNKPIHKITEIDFYIKNELTNIKLLEGIKNHKNYYYFCENSTSLKIRETEDEIKHIRLGREIKSTETVLLKFEDRELIYLKNYLKALSPSTKYIFTIIDFYKRLLNSIYFLASKQIVHNNINFDSVVIDNKEQPLLTNFSFSINISRTLSEQYIQHFFIEHDASYIEWPLEIHILSYLLTNKLSSLSNYNIEKIIQNVIENHTILKTFGETVVSSYKKDAIEYFKKYVNKSYDYILTDVLQFYNTWDNYSLSIMFLRILIGIHKTIQIKNKFIILFMKLLVCNINLNPLKRHSIEITTNKFESLLESLEPKDYKDIINNLMSA